LRGASLPETSGPLAPANRLASGARPDADAEPVVLSRVGPPLAGGRGAGSSGPVATVLGELPGVVDGGLGVSDAVTAPGGWDEGGGGRGEGAQAVVVCVSL